MSSTPYNVEHVGEEGQPVIVIDNFSSDPDALLAQAKISNYAQGGRHYPGVRAFARAGYLAERNDLLQAVFRDVFGMKRGASVTECNFSAVTTPPDQLTPIQRLPHFDGTASGRLALLHYLCKPEDGGTSFYRHVSTGFETITDERLQHYDNTLRAEVARNGLPPAAYFDGRSDTFERIGNVEASYNRVAIYRGVLLHSGDILQPELIGRPGYTPRLSINTFFEIDA